VLRPTLYIVLIAERRTEYEDRCFCCQARVANVCKVWIELSTVSDVLGPKLYFIGIKILVLSYSVLCSFAP